MERSADEIYLELEQHYFGQDMDERVTIEALPEILRDVSVFVDIGASLGQYTFFANQIMQKGRIYAIEADPRRYERLRDDCVDWEHQSTNEICVLHRAIADHNGEMTFFVADTGRSGGLFPHHPQHRKVDWREVRVEGVTLDTLFAGRRAPDLVKVDVEGAEYRLLLGAQDLLDGRKTMFLVEVHPWKDPSTGYGPSDVFALFAQYGYSYTRVHHHFLFRPSQSRLVAHLKSIPPRLIFQHQFLLNPAKAVLNRLSRR